MTAKKSVRFISLVLVIISLLGTCLIASSAANTGNQRKDIVTVAQGEIGNTNDNHRYRNDSLSWCASFVIWCARKAGVPESIIKTTGFACPTDMGVPYKYSKAYGGNYTPKAGDLIFFLWESDKGSYSWSHVGIVESVSSTQVTAIEGNSNGKVRRNTYALSSSSIKAYGIPNYKTGSTSTPSQSNSFTCNFKMKSGAYFNAYSNYNCSSKVGRVYTNDVITVKEIKNGVAKVVCPWSDSTGNYNRTVYCKVTDMSFKATKYINAFCAVNGSKVGRVYPGDVCQVLSIMSNGWAKVKCPWDDGTMKTIFIKYNEIY